MSLRKAYLIILVSFVWLIFGGIVFNLINPQPESPIADVLGLGILFGFAGIFLVGTAVWAGAKGYTPSLLGVVLGWLGPIGLLILVFLPDKSAGIG